MPERRNLSDIAIPSRRRKDMGDIDALAASISDLGLLQPLAVWPDGQLACGERRLLAVRKLGWKDVPVHVLADATDLATRLKAERDENTCRKGFLPTEAVALGKELERLEKPKAKERQATSTGGVAPKPACGKLPQADPGKSRDKVGEAVGMSGKTYEKAKQVVEAAKANPKKFGDLPDKMDAKSVDAAFKDLKKRQAPSPPAAGKASSAPAKRHGHDHSDAMAEWLRILAGHTCYVHIKQGGLNAILADAAKWNWPQVGEEIIPMLRAIQEEVGLWLTTIEGAYERHQQTDSSRGRKRA